MSNKEAVRRYRERNQEKVRQMTREWRERNKERIAEYGRNKTRRNAGFTKDSFAIALSVQGHACAICRAPFSDMPNRAIHADHNHGTNTARGVLCHHCNVGLGNFKDSPDLLTAAARYLVKPTIEEVTMLEPKVEDLKSAVEANTSAIRELIAAIRAGVPTTAAQVAAVVAEAPAVEKTEPKKDPARAEVSDAAEHGKTAAQAVEALAGHANKPTPTATYEDAKAAVLKISKEKGRDAAVAVLSTFGVQKLPDLQPENYGALVAKVDEALA